MSGDAKHGDGNQVEGLVKHVMADGRPCGRPDGHKGAHRSPESVERKRARDRARMARLHDQGETWWQRNEDLRAFYDMARSSGNYLVALRERIVSHAHVYPMGTLADELANLAEARVMRREGGRAKFARDRAKLPYLPCRRCGEPAVAGWQEHAPTWAIHARCLRDVIAERSAAA